jgi:hypothetical protein
MCALYITAKDKPDGMDIFVNGKSLSRAESKLSLAAKKLGVPDLMSFFSQNPDDVAEMIDDPDIIKTLPAERWFEPAEGLVTVHALMSHLKDSAADFAILDDLREFEVVLLRLKELGMKWHLSVDY